MTGTVPSNYPTQPVSAYVQQVETFDRIEHGVDAASDAIRIRDEIARQIGHVAVQGTSQSR